MTRADESTIGDARAWLTSISCLDVCLNADPVLKTLAHALDNLELLRAPGMVSTMPRQEMRRVTLDTVLPEIRLVRPELAALEAAVDRAWAWLRVWQRAMDVHPVKLGVHRHIVRADIRVLRAVDAWQRAKRGGA